MSPPLMSASTMRSPLAKLFLLLLVALIVYLSIIRQGSPAQAKFHRRPIDLSSLELSDAEIKSLEAQHKLRPLKSRGATIFVDTDGAIRIPPDYILQKMEFRDLEELYHRYLASIQTVCKRQIHIGAVYDGGYEICQDKEYNPPNSCLVYSVGSNNDFTFDKAIHKVFGCEVHCFDPSTDMKDHTHSPAVYFHPLGLGDRDEVNDLQWRMRTLKSMREQLGHAKRNIDVLKIDIELGEWTAFPDIITSGQLQGVKQLIVEFHSVVYGSWSVDRSHEAYRKYLGILRQIYDQGYRIFFYRLWIAECCRFVDEFEIDRTGCHEASFVKVH